VEYRLTDLGRSLSRALEPVDRWAEQHLDAVLKAKQTNA
jgi:DNA-binding HxlR family transcriptional regulator